jgi:hypothetical protein
MKKQILLLVMLVAGTSSADELYVHLKPIDWPASGTYEVSEVKKMVYGAERSVNQSWNIFFGKWKKNVRQEKANVEEAVMATVDVYKKIVRLEKEILERELKNSQLEIELLNFYLEQKITPEIVGQIKVLVNDSLLTILKKGD